jgi:hypothetical protein
MSKTALWIGVATLLVSILGITPAYLVFFDKPDLVFETQIEKIPLPKGLPGQLPDSLALVTIQNLGHQPSVDVQANLAIDGELIDYQVQGPNPAYAQISHSRSNLTIMVTCSRLAPGEYPIKISAWYKGANSGPDVGVSDTTGAGRKVNSISAEQSRYKQFGTGLLGLLFGSIGSLVAIGTLFRARALKKSISEAARQLQESENVLRPANDKVGTIANQSHEPEE